MEPLPECEAKTHFAELMVLWRRIRSIHKKTHPTEEEVDEYPNLVRNLLKLLDTKFSWFKPLPNQIHRLVHNFCFLVADRNSLGVKSLEGLEKGNFTTQVMDAHQTFKGSRKKANKGVFKLLRLKSSRKLRQYRRKPPTRLQRCSRCKQFGHNASNKGCQRLLEGQAEGDLIQDENDNERDMVGAGDEDERDGVAAGDEGSVDDVLDESNLDDLLGDSEDELF